jgi:two-component system, NtrC family, response regulator AtoC
VQVKAAAMLGISERSLWHRVKKLGIKIDAVVSVE